MDAFEAVEYGLVDSVLGEGTPGLVYPKGRLIKPLPDKSMELWQVKDYKDRENIPGEEAFIKRTLENSEPIV